MSLTEAGYAARRAAQQERVRILYRQCLKNALSWVIRRPLFYEDASRIRDEFEAYRHVDDIDTIDRMIGAAEAKLIRWSHPDPYIVPWAPKGSKFARNPPVPEVEIVFDHGLEKYN
ncbi:hypothetical protein SUGI_0911470 [Cryptomeria japonica]|uniref:NADH dehydrogenase [ubiquinone] 1 beta subcomplex subunit 9 isoform X2 n=1 Tax=Cryptomeria japonica TaxID=3369 RepID=UPI002414A903|nr:NADH dehydrogenase [ubiquinone] 1 beta subcomplex subunit 9 isoform X2 [Cryptomeria japonica]GLJ43781.1 hypothetical protein SUGI_0911470 [Cryptomeria japonica]